MQIWTKRAYEKAGAQDCMRVLVDRIWPRGVSKDEAHIDHWLEDVAPSTELRKWFKHDPQKWEEFKKRYFQELQGNSEALQELQRMAEMGRVTLVFSAKDQRKQYLEKRA
jgi:uncharacterized protein YeaO (DUF488 family)